MIGFLILLFLAGVGLTAYGIWEQKHVYGDQYFAVGRVVGYQAYRPSNSYAKLGSKLVNAQYPIVSVTLESGELRQLRLHSPVAYGAGGDFPELRIGGEISVTYFGQNPKEAFLTDHPLAEKPVKCSSFLIAGIAALGATVFVIGSYIWFAHTI